MSLKFDIIFKRIILFDEIFENSGQKNSTLGSQLLVKSKNFHIWIISEIWILKRDPVIESLKFEQNSPNHITTHSQFSIIIEIIRVLTLTLADGLCETIGRKINYVGNCIAESTSYFSLLSLISFLAL